MAWNQMRKLPAEKLTSVKNWEQKGLVYWAKRFQTSQRNLAAADSSSAAGHALEQREIAGEAIRRLFLLEPMETI